MRERGGVGGGGDGNYMRTQPKSGGNLSDF